MLSKVLRIAGNTHIYGYMGIWVYRFMGIWIYGFMGLWVYGYMGIWVYGYVGVMVGIQPRHPSRVVGSTSK
jgi:hypothetical protein